MDKGGLLQAWKAYGLHVPDREGTVCFLLTRLFTSIMRMAATYRVWSEDNMACFVLNTAGCNSLKIQNII